MGSGGEGDRRVSLREKDLIEQFRKKLEEDARKSMIRQSLQTIRKVCRENFADGDDRGCRECHLSRSDGKCAVTWDVPDRWQFPEDQPWRAFL